MLILYVHWHQQEAEAAIAAMQAEGHEVLGHTSTQEHLRLGDWMPQAVVISLERLPSHGRAIAEWFQEAKKRRGVPLIFVGGKADKIGATKKKFPQAIYCAAEELPAILGQISVPVAREGKNPRRSKTSS